MKDIYKLLDNKRKQVVNMTGTKVKNYIKDHFIEWYNNEKIMGSFEGNLEKLNNVNLDDFSEICDAILYMLYIEKIKEDYMYRQMGCIDSLYEYFKNWCEGLCEPIDTSYYEHSPIDIIIDWYELDEREFYNHTYNLTSLREMITGRIYDCILKYSKRSVI